MKKMRKLIPAFAMLLVSAIMMSTASFAWFTMGSTAEATGMQLTAKADSALVISATPTYEEFSTADSQLSFDNPPQTKFYPATHDEDPETPSASGLVYPSDNDGVNAGTGMYAGAYTDVPVANANDSGYYYDYVVYLGSAGGAKPNVDLIATISIDGIAKYLHNALSIDFYWATGLDGETGDYAFLETVNLMTVAANNNEKDVTIASNITIPALFTSADGENIDSTPSYIAVRMRVYFDGALEDATIQNQRVTYVRNAMITDVAAQFAVSFEAVNHTPTQNG